jgi:hypothetical protein
MSAYTTPIRIVVQNEEGAMPCPFLIQLYNKCILRRSRGCFVLARPQQQHITTVGEIVAKKKNYISARVFSGA